MRVLRFVVIGSVLVLASSCRRRGGYLEDHTAHMSAMDLAPSATTTGTSQGAAGLPASDNSAKARLAASPRHSEWVKVAWEPGSADSLMAFIVYPTTANAKSPVVVVVHEIYGLSSWVRGVADQVAAEGFIAIAPDLNSRTRGGPSTDELTRDSAQKLIRGVAPAERNRGIAAVANYAMTQPSAAAKYAVIGYCWGGQTAWVHAINGGVKGYSGSVAFYGNFPYMNAATPPMTATPNADSMAKINVPVMLLSGTKDPRIGAAMPAIDSMMKAMKKDYYGRNYENAVHGFLRAQNDPKAVRDSTAPGGIRPALTLAERDTVEEQANLFATRDGWPRTVTFLKKQLGMK
jgi:carboxymethylenebutenolidase